MGWEDWSGRRRRRLPFDREFPFRFFTGDFEDMVREMERRMDEYFREFNQRVPEGLVREKKLPDGSTVREIGPFVYGYSVTIDQDGKPVIRQFGNLKPSPAKPGLDVREVREPLVDVIDSEAEVKVLAEIPGVEKQDIKVTAAETTVSIHVDTAERKYDKEMDLPAEVDPKTAKSSYKNGVLEITLTKIKGKKPKGVPVDIE